MSIVERLQIRGIRSFGVKSEDVQEIHFSSPITLILGANGCGKTTIIECLKYALTGETPPGTDRGKLFVHDPSIFHNSECLGQVQLSVRNMRGDAVKIIRSLKLKYQHRKSKFETLDSTIQFDVDGQKHELSLKQLDANLKMSQAMGVSKAILNNVIFCHQEDSSWPLDEGKKLKERFDAIFGTTEYNKAIDKLIKKRNLLNEERKAKEGDLKLLSHLKDETEQKLLKKETLKNSHTEISNSIEAQDKVLVPINDRINKIVEIEMQASKLHGQHVEMKTKYEKCCEHQKSLNKKIKNKFDGGILTLDREIRAFKTRVEQQKKDLDDETKQYNETEQNKKKLVTEYGVLDRERSSVVHQKEQEHKLITKRADSLKQLCCQLEIQVSTDLANNSKDVEAKIREALNALKRKKVDLSELTADHDKIDQEMQTNIDRYREQKAKLESDIISKKKQMAQLKQEHNKKGSEIEMVEKSAETLKKITKEIEDLNAKYETKCKSVNLDQMKADIQERKQHRDSLQDRLDKLDEELTKINSVSSLNTEISLKEKQKMGRENEIRRVKSKHSDNLKRLFGGKDIESNFKNKVQTIYEDAVKEIADLNRSVSKNQQKITELTFTRKSFKDEIKRLEKDLADGEEKVYEFCHSSPFEEVLEKVKENVAKFRLDYGVHKSSETLYKQYLQKLQQEPCCPLCHNDMTDDGASTIASELSDKIKRLPDNIQRSQKILNTEEKKYDELLSLQPLIKGIKQMKEDIPKKKQLLKKTEDQLSNEMQEKESLELSLSEPNAKLDLANSMLGDMSLLDEAHKDVNKMDQEIMNLKNKIPKNLNITMSSEDAQLQKSTIATEIKCDRKDIDRLEKKFDIESEALNSLREKRNSLKDKQIKLNEGVQALTQLKQRLQEITDQMNIIKTDIGELEDQINPLKVSLSNAVTTKEQTKNENRKKANAFQSKITTMEKIQDEISRCSNEIQKLSDMNLAHKLEQVNSKMERCTSQQKALNVESEKLRTIIDQLKEEIASQEIIERDLNDNRELKLLEDEIGEIKTTLDSLTNDLSTLDYRTVVREKTQLCQKRDQIQELRSEMIGRRGNLNNQIKSAESELNDPKYRDSVRNYTHTEYQATVLKKMIKDLVKYNAALEAALLKYHSEKMEQINKLISEFWRTIYRGNDIDCIQIRTDEAKEGTTEKRRSYNYRVVQLKNETEIDLRGRCSAGQRVLACLIIRMALAETFSANCGVLALDEPTTNLDKVNIAALCLALNRIVEERGNMASFMLIVITHDEDFITTLGKVDRYYKVSRNDAGKSVIQKVRLA